MLEQDIMRKEQMDTILPKKLEFVARDNKEYEVKVIIDSIVYGK